ncbi:MAG: hydroxymethylglutaryl-CoA reductase, degradative [Candidatus Altiarchaeum hamiconexum]|uniref:3-hydroxy-3-methylglutaryl coenzyme A reductase n=1 Tax=Candidatus Altarchaeum hamiconexum TaxID=1803513 RepID=A0A8J7YUI2_9ARCH|nr:hydroxymethylglutaryl-CoA reductase, degradative [Candidatus Altarchaeum hamiconexum]OIQ04698.1 MAG: hydroxymethylglutaryl-CoA reductase, degradative [Candidatus Altarchaeum sp. CG2_30_32_3053]PIN67397.1 MAG: hydroxymethylglutaryl-CoA reductase, degradative [Candidatus Altarchaeum sp. CG12_big_fil_rev_8_21_14_0_65_33_22]PIV27049.1 MAG: hydroxymethylglutaryl-CoA reductase, degradative [Candidatus Altarchaeum sp. CG03_land_8_20_14_0_80_32_618]PIX49085.1 MAG: hydroxymethylglutaryl-CoA reductase
MDSKIHLYKMSLDERRKNIKELTNLTDEEIAYYNGNLTNIADKMVENVIGTYELPLGIATNFLINGNDYLIPMATEEASVIAAASNAAKMARVKGGFITHTDEPVMIGQIQVINLDDVEIAQIKILKYRKEIIEMANACDATLVKFGGGCKDIEVRKISDNILVVHLLVDCRDAMGANAVNTMTERVKEKIKEITGGDVLLKIISNLAIYRKAYSYAIFDKDTLGGESVVDKILTAYKFAVSDIFRCATHNKGIMNGIDALIIATGNDFRAVEAGAHSYAAMHGYIPLTHYSKDKDGNLVGSIEIPMAVGIIGGATKVHPQARTNLKILNVKSAGELAEVAASLGLAQNLAALKALSTEGIQRGHMELHARNIAISAGVPAETTTRVAEIMIKDRKINMDYAKEIFEKIR